LPAAYVLKSASAKFGKTAFGEDIKMKRKTLGFALLLFANIFAVPDAFFFYIGLAVGIIGLCLVVSGLRG